MEPKVLRVLRRIEEEDTEDRTVVGRPREERLFALHPDTAGLIHIMIQSAKCRNIVEIGVAHGYSTIWLAHAARITGGRLTALEINPKSIEAARENVAETGLSEYVDFVLGDARETLARLQGPLDFVLMDCWEELYPDCFKLIVPLLRPGGLLVTDNIEPSEPASYQLIKAINDHPDMETVTVPIGRRIEVSVKSLSATG